MNTENETNNSIYNNLKIIKYFGINLTREVQNLYTENYKILLIEIKGLYKETTSSCSWIRFHIMKKATPQIGL